MDKDYVANNKEIIEKVKELIRNKCEEEFGDMSSDIKYLTIDIDEFEDQLDSLVEEE